MTENVIGALFYAFASPPTVDGFNFGVNLTKEVAYQHQGSPNKISEKKFLQKVYEFLAYFTPTAFVQKPDALMLLLFSGPAVTLNHCTVDLVLESAPFAQQCVRMRSSQVFVVTCYKYIKVLVLVLVSSFSSYMLQIYKWMSLSARVDLMAV